MRIIAGEARGKKLLGPRDDSIRPALDRIRESLFSVLDDAFENGLVLDLFAGVGAFGLEALSRGAREVVFVENAPASLEVLNENIRLLGAEAQSRVVRADALKYARKLERLAFDVALADYESWSRHVAPGGLLVFHDVFEDPAAGGQAPYEVWRRAASSGRFAPESTTGSLRSLRRV